jgi:hypothetical protein
MPPLEICRPGPGPLWTMHKYGPGCSYNCIFFFRFFLPVSVLCYYTWSWSIFFWWFYSHSDYVRIFLELDECLSLCILDKLYLWNWFLYDVSYYFCFFWNPFLVDTVRYYFLNQISYDWHIKLNITEIQLNTHNLQLLVHYSKGFPVKSNGTRSLIVSHHNMWWKEIQRISQKWTELLTEANQLMLCKWPFRHYIIMYHIITIFHHSPSIYYPSSVDLIISSPG